MFKTKGRFRSLVFFFFFFPLGTREPFFFEAPGASIETAGVTHCMARSAPSTEMVIS